MPETLTESVVLKGKARKREKGKGKAGRMSRKGRKRGEKAKKKEAGWRVRKASVSGLPRNGNSKALANLNSYNPYQLTYLSNILPPDSACERWLFQLRRKLGNNGLLALGFPPRQARQDVAPLHGTAWRLTFLYWSALFCPSNLSSAFHLATWGRFNENMPKDYREAAMRLLDRKSGPARARALGLPHKPFVKPWQGKTPRRMIYTVPPSLPLL